MSTAITSNFLQKSILEGHEEPNLWKWRDVFEKLPWFGLVLAASPHVKTLTTIQIAGIQFDWLFYGLAILIIGLQPQLLAQRFPLRLLVIASISLLPAIFQDLWNPIRTGVDLLSLWVLFAATLGMIRRVDYPALFDAYLFFSAVSAAWGVLEMLFGQTSDFGLDGFCYESSHYVVTAAPAPFYALASNRVPLLIRVLLPVSIFLTFSTTGFAVASILVLFLLRRRFWLSLAMVFLGVGIWNSSEAIRERVLQRTTDEAVFQNQDEYDFGSNKTTASLLSNWYVAKRGFDEFFPLGIGYSNHNSGYYEFLSGTPYELTFFYGTNDKSGHNLGIRYLSEFGFVGVLALGVFIFRVIRSRNHRNEVLNIILLASSMHFVSKCVKLGSYLDYGTPFFACLIVAIVSSRENVK